MTFDAEMEALLRAYLDAHPTPPLPIDEAIRALLANWKQRGERIEEALALHAAPDGTERLFCAECRVVWPCPTVRILRG